MKHAEHAVSPIIGVMLMVVVTIIIAAVVSAFATNTDLSKQTGPTVTLEAKTLYNTNAGVVGASWTTTTHHDAVYHEASDGTVDCNEVYDEFCDSYYYAHQSECDAGNCVTTNPALATPAYTEPAYDETIPHSYGFNGNTGSNTNGLLFTDAGGDPFDLKDLELSVRYFNLASTVYGTDTKRHCGVNWTSSRPSYADVLAAVAAAGSSIQNLQITSEADYNRALANSAGSTDCRYFIKVNETSTDDTIIRPGDQFIFLVDANSLTSTGSTASYSIWAIAPQRSDGSFGMSIGINTEGGETEWWLNHRPSGKTLARGMLAFPRT